MLSVASDMSDPLDMSPSYRSLLPSALRESASQARAIDRSELLRQAAAEIERLHTVIDCYAHAAEAAASEINQLRNNDGPAAA